MVVYFGIDYPDASFAAGEFALVTNAEMRIRSVPAATGMEFGREEYPPPNIVLFLDIGIAVIEL